MSFDGIGTGRLALSQLLNATEVIAFFAWEKDKDCMDLVSHHFPDTWHRQDFTLGDPAQFAKDLMAWFGDEDFIILIAAGPPCPDYSRIKGGQVQRTQRTGRQEVRPLLRLAGQG